MRDLNQQKNKNGEAEVILSGSYKKRVYSTNKLFILTFLFHSSFTNLTLVYSKENNAEESFWEFDSICNYLLFIPHFM